MTDSIKDRLTDRNISSKLFFTVLSLELAILVIAFLLDLLFQLQLYTFGRLLHYFILLYATALVWSGLSDGKLSKLWQIILFSIIPLSEFFLINILGYSNLWGSLSLVLYLVVLVAILGIDMNNPSNGNRSELSGKIMKSAIKGLTK